MMKESIFNNKQFITDEVVAIYNSYNDKTLFVSKNKIKLENLLISDSHILKKLIDNGFVVSDDCDEVGNYLKYMRTAECDMSVAHLIINPTINCNFNCWYCYENHIKSLMSEDIIERLKSLIAKIFAEKRLLQISFFGGEPMLCYKNVILPMLEKTKYLSEQLGGEYFVNMTTNGYLFNEKRIEKLKEYNFNGVQITLDGYKDIHDKIRKPVNGNGSYDRIVSNIINILEHGIPVTVRINCTKENIDTIVSVAKSFVCLDRASKKLLNFDFQIVWQEENKEIISQKMNKIVREFVKVGLNASKMSFRDFCYADKRNSCVVNYNGDLYKCTAVDFLSTKRDGYLSEKGDLIWENNSMEERMASKLKNKPCLSCRILPLCHGGCTKHSLNAVGDYCIYNFNEEEKDEVVLDAIEHNIHFSKVTRL